MTLAERLDLLVRLRVALAVGMIVSLVGVFVVTPRAIRKLRGAGIVGRDMHRSGRPEEDDAAAGARSTHDLQHHV
jgi:hypothetical protein